MKETTIKLDQKTLLYVVLGVLILGAAFQAYQITLMKNEIASAGLSLGSSSSRTSVATQSGDSSGQTQSLPDSISDLPQMVGGC
ncbi:hypothetical protein COT72_00150 [archaeon CG10_big_fil_rev_8_21_14_0_10_43_11]|nr:MAG: hypothetical protein COT72_00150 [archaeon CG10_big_fil_rev_8_21_14_0_10_43_11]